MARAMDRLWRDRKRMASKMPLSTQVWMTEQMEASLTEIKIN